MLPPFVIYALPRSRTAWLSRFLTCDPWQCHHDLVTDLYSIEELLACLKKPYTGTVETGMIRGFRVVRHLIPDIRTVIIKRPIEEVRRSLAKFGIAGAETDKTLEYQDAMLDEASKCPGTITVSYQELNSVIACRTIFAYCLGQQMIDTWWYLLKDKNIQVDMPERMKKLQENYAKMEVLKAEVAEYERTM